MQVLHVLRSFSRQRRFATFSGCGCRSFWIFWPRDFFQRKHVENVTCNVYVICMWTTYFIQHDVHMCIYIISYIYYIISYYIISYYIILYYMYILYVMYLGSKLIWQIETKSRTLGTLCLNRCLMKGAGETAPTARCEEKASWSLVTHLDICLPMHL